MRSDPLIARALTWRYVVALTLVAMLTTFAWISLHLVITEQKSTAAVVNISGRQRMLSQRTALYSSLLVHAEPAQRPALRQELQAAAELMARSHEGLLHGNAEMNLPPTMSDAVRAMYFDGPVALDGLVRDYLASVQALLQAPDAALTPDNPLLGKIIAVSPTVLVSSLNKMVSQYQQEGEAAINRLQTAETLVWLFTLLLLVLEASLIFRPFTRRMEHIIGQLRQATDALFQSREHLRIVTENANDWLWKTDATGVLTDFTGRFQHMGDSREALGYPLVSLIDGAFHCLHSDELVRAMADERAFRDLVIPLRSATASALWVRSSGVPYRGKGGDFLGYVGVCTDITQHKKLEDEVRNYQEHLEELVAQRTLDLESKSRQLAESEEIFRLISSSASDAIIMLDPVGRITYWNPAAKRMFGYDGDQVLGQDFHELLTSPALYDEILADFQSVAAGSEVRATGRTLEMSALRKDGEAFPVELSVSALLLKGQRHAIGIMRDISERKKTEARIRQLAYYDTLTDLPNRRLLFDRLEQTLALARRHRYAMALMFIDLDGFKKINDSLGHDVGDELLQEVARRLSAAVRSGDTVSRQGGDEFVIILERIENPEDAGRVAEKLITTLQAPIVIRDQALIATASVGIAIAQPEQSDNIQSLMKKADVAMYAAKQAGRNCFRYAEEAPG